MLIPEKLKKGDTIGILAACGDIKDTRKIDTAKKLFESAGYKVKLSDTIYTKKDYLCADDNIRAHELNKFFADKTIKAIIAARGGYGALRILDKIDYGLIKNNPKIFAGYSDVTALSLMIYKNTGLVTYNAPMAYSDFGSDIDEYTKQSFFNVLENGISEITIDTPRVFSGGVASGPMTATFLLPFAIGACQSVGGNIVADAFGVVAMVAMTPLITIQVIGLIYKLKSRPVQSSIFVETPASLRTYADDDIIEL